MKGIHVLFSLLYLALLFSAGVPSSISSKHHYCAQGDSLLLLQFIKHFEIDKLAPSPCQDGPSHYLILSKKLTWNESSDCCKWEGVTCDSSTGHVIGLDLSCRGLQGLIHHNSSLFQLRHLQKLNLAFNDFNYNALPNEIGSLTSLTHLNLSESLLSGTIPSKISHLSKLVSLDLSSNFQRNGSSLLFLQNLTKLDVLSLSFNGISCNIPWNISASLRYLDLSSNNIVGSIPDSIFQLSELQSLILCWNLNLVSSLPKFSWSCNHTLQWLDLSVMSLFGELPNSIGNLTHLKVLGLGSNEFNGSVPFTISNLNQLTKLDLSRNNFEGEIPDAFSSLQEVTTLDLQENNFIGLFPSSIVNMTRLEDLQLEGYSLIGSLPSVASELQNLKTLSLSGNALNGTIPPWIFSIPSLIELDLSQNRFTGQLPEILSESLDASRLQNLQTLYLFGNALNGTIPHWIFSIPSIIKLDLNQNQFTGQLLEISSKSLESVNLSHNRLDGQIPPSFLKLFYLKVLDLSFNLFSWSNGWRTKVNISDIPIGDLRLSSCEIREFPTFIRNLTYLEHLDLSNNKLEGQIPNWFASVHWSEIKYLDLSQNRLTGGINQLLVPNIFYIDLHSNQLQGPLSTTICNSSMLQFLNLNYNKFNGTIPPCLGELDQLSVLDLGRNNFNWIAPTIFAKDNSLTTIVLNGNQLRGPIPRSLVNCTQLEVLDLGNNKLNDTFPKWLRDLQELLVLILSSNKLYGPIASMDSKIWFPKLRIFDLSCNGFNGAFPKYFFNDFKAMINVDQSEKEASYLGTEMWDGGHYNISINLVIKSRKVHLDRVLTILTTIDLSCNQIEGEIPMFIGNLNSLRLLNLSHNQFNGSIPHQLGDIKLLESLDISWNQLKGKIPEQITSLTFLEVLNLSQNNLVGPIPTGKQFNTFGNDSYGGNLNLCGFPLSRECNDNNRSHEPHQHVEQEEKSNFLCGFTWRVVVIGFGCGLVFGILIENLMSRIGKPEWFVNFYGGNRRRKFSRLKKNGRRH